MMFVVEVMVVYVVPSRQIVLQPILVHGVVVCIDLDRGRKMCLLLLMMIVL